MSRLMSVARTTEQVRSRSKTVTRRLGWWEDKRGRRLLLPGNTLTLCEKVQGRRGAPLVRLAEVEVVSVSRERLWDITDADVRREGLTKNDADFEEWTEPDMWPTRLAWISWFCEAMDCRPDDMVTRIEWVYLPAVNHG